MYLRQLARLVFDYRSFPLASLTLHVPSSLLPCPQVPTPIQCRRASPHSPCQRRFVFPFVFTLTHLLSSSIALTSLHTRGLILIGLITSLPHLLLSTSISPDLPRSSLRDPSSKPSYLASPQNKMVITLFPSSRLRANDTTDVPALPRLSDFANSCLSCC